MCTVDELESLRYVIGKLTYEFSPFMVRLSMQCIKESFNMNIDEYNQKEKYEVLLWCSRR